MISGKIQVGVQLLQFYLWNIRENMGICDDLCDAFVQLHQDFGCTVIKSMNQTLSAPECFCLTTST